MIEAKENLLFAIIDYGMGNVGSIQNMLKVLGIASIITSKPEEIAIATHLILPGVGAFDAGMKNLKSRGLIEVLEQEVLEKKKPILGICLGMQLLLQASEEGNEAGLGWISGRSQKFSASKKLKVPHMGWNSVSPANKSPLFNAGESDPRFYFVHSYKVSCENSADIAGTTNYGQDFVAAIQKENIYGVQFHPEKSHKFGLKVFENFVKETSL